MESAAADPGPPALDDGVLLEFITGWNPSFFAAFLLLLFFFWQERKKKKKHRCLLGWIEKQKEGII